MKSAACLTVILTLVSGISSVKLCGDRVTEAFITCRNEYYSQVKEYGGNYCCIVARFSYCFERKTPTECETNPTGAHAIELAKAEIAAACQSQDCGSQGKYPSAACVFFFYKTWFIIGGVLIVGLLVGACIAVTVVRSRRRNIVIN